MLAERFVQQGMTPEQAQYAASRQFGNSTSLKEVRREMSTLLSVETVWRDVRYALRALRQDPAFTIVAILSLALGIGANTAIYSFMDAILLRSLPVSHPESLVVFKWHARDRGSVVKGMIVNTGGSYRDPKAGRVSSVFPYPALEFFQRNAPSLDSVFSYYPADHLSLTIRDETEVVTGHYVSGDYFRGMGAFPAAGRLIQSEDDQPGAPAVAVLSYPYSQNRFGTAASAVGQSIRINNIPVVVVGVASQEFFGAEPAAIPNLYVPMHTNLLLEPSSASASAQRYIDKNFYWVELMGRLKPGVTFAQAQASLAPLFHNFVLDTAQNEKERADLPELMVLGGAAGLDSLRRQYSKPLYILLAMVGLILAIACANVANLLLARATARRKEVAVRLGIGASRGRVIRQLLTESVLLACIGGALGMAFGLWGIRVLTLLLANGRENFTLHAELNWHVLVLTIGLSVLVGILFGLVPASQATRVDVSSTLKETRMPGIGGRIHATFPMLSLGRVLGIAQIALSLLLLVAAGLFVRTLSNLQSIQLGFNRENVLLFTLDAKAAGHEARNLEILYGDIRDRVAALPGVRNASFSQFPLVSGGMILIPAVIPGLPPPPPGPAGFAGPPPNMPGVLAVGPSFFSTMQIPLVAGREFDKRDEAGSARVAVVNERFIKLFGVTNPVGRMMKMSNRSIEIVGVSKDARFNSLKDEYRPMVYMPYTQSIRPLAEMSYEVRTSGNPLGYASTVRQMVRQVDPRIPFSAVKTQAEQIDETINQEITFARLCTVFAVLALAIACVGIYGTMAYSVARRTGEIGIRMALGAQRSGVVWMVLREVLGLGVVGLAIGLPVALGFSRYLSSLLFGIRPNDPLALGTAVIILFAAAAAAAYVPARRAAKIDPMLALRHE